MSMIQRFLAWNAARPQRKAARAERRRLRDLGSGIRCRHQSLPNYLHFNPKGTEEKFTFEARLKAEYGWDDDQVRSAIAEYAKFLSIAACADGPVVPSVIVDMVWKQHILFGRHYVTGLCGTILGRFIHRRASIDLVSDDAVLGASWKRTQEAYTAAFGEPPAGIWKERSTSFTKVVHFPRSSAARQFLRDRRADDETKSSSSGFDPLSAYLFYVVLIQPHYNSDTHQHTTKTGNDAAAVVSDPDLGTDGGTDSTFDTDSGTDSSSDTGSSCSSCSSCSS